MMRGAMVTSLRIGREAAPGSRSEHGAFTPTLVAELVDQPVEDGGMEQCRHPTLAVRRTPRWAIENDLVNAARVHKRSLEDSRLVERNVVVFRASQDQHILTNTVG